MPITRVCFARSGAPASAGRDGTIRTYAVRRASDVTSASRYVLENASDEQAANGSTTHAADAAPPADNPLADPHNDGDAAVPAVGHGPASLGSGSVSAPLQKRRQLLTCVGVEAVPGMSAPVIDVMAAGAHGSEERLVCGFQVSTETSEQTSEQAAVV